MSDPKPTWGGPNELDEAIDRVFKLATAAGFNASLRLSRPRRAKAKPAKKAQEPGPDAGVKGFDY